ncbi:helix-turn-helix domain-containing protein [Roseateles sp. DC23W]|uniref:Helix-turn-helix domain-containing protein n=1 Tax=Pelomonas dachongensis TaxID=3299029 RepID=A0ABW7EU55_9BURK
MPRRSYQQLQPEERVTLAGLSLQNKSLRDIAQVLGRSASTLSRELRRKVGPQGYAADGAQAQAAQRRIDQLPWPKLHPLKSSDLQNPFPGNSLWARPRRPAAGHVGLSSG